MKRLISKIIILGVISILPLMIYNIVLDPYSVLRKDYRNMIVCPNERFAKTDFILRNPGKYDSLLFGSSRVSQIPMAVLNSKTGGRWYNMSFISGVVAENLEILKLFVKHKVPIRNMMIGLDYFSFQMLPLQNQTRTILYPDTLRDKLKFYYTFLTLEPDSGMLYEVRFDGKSAYYDLEGTGEYDFLKKEENLKLHPEEHDPKFRLPVFVVCANRIPETIAEIREIIAICRENGIGLKFFINPGHASSYLCDNLEFQNRVRTELAALTDFWDFSRPSSITMDNFNYVDIIHYRKKIGSLLVEKMSGGDTKAPKDFGYLVTKENVADYLERSSVEYHALKKKLNPTCLPCGKN
ncbi:MAG TPA: hypothetical protein PLA65_13985 [Spirochaetota bacterium]|nr:hypothetical protein [Spirochaetota bacterium]HOD15370.1 hypothetical protein [Spirochaetota bacterium]HPG50912.1 hypothetical protein [Spirochaetota bacterium]HPN13167.1 hypothetical protein [Spirochaetota bacterium]